MTDIVESATPAARQLYSALLSRLGRVQRARLRRTTHPPAT